MNCKEAKLDSLCNWCSYPTIPADNTGCSINFWSNHSNYDVFHPQMLHWTNEWLLAAVKHKNPKTYAKIVKMKLIK